VNTLIIEKTERFSKYFFTQLNLFPNNVFELNKGIRYTYTTSVFTNPIFLKNILFSNKYEKKIKYGHSKF